MKVNGFNKDSRAVALYTEDDAVVTDPPAVARDASQLFHVARPGVLCHLTQRLFDSGGVIGLLLR